MQADVSAAIAARYQDLEIEWDVDVTAYSSIVTLFEDAMQRYPDLPACSSVGHSISYRELDTLSANFRGARRTGTVTSGLPRGMQR